ncbi:hypothetical protein GCM10011505_04230 [Tistrella bauzanensis]|uniref:Uncharacterized protein n=1 Tax=Tistrella bauzanensis TaxID=657419 RepID=A0ABQ1I829_9PROT|nr:hypothetical protein GCM10011505_04230 [Tistrella bauzanensis]
MPGSIASGGMGPVNGKASVVSTGRTRSDATAGAESSRVTTPAAASLAATLRLIWIENRAGYSGRSGRGRGHGLQWASPQAARPVGTIK